MMLLFLAVIMLLLSVYAFIKHTKSINKNRLGGSGR
jgi:hypothetical protein